MPLNGPILTAYKPNQQTRDLAISIAHRCYNVNYGELSPEIQAEINWLALSVQIDIKLITPVDILDLRKETNSNSEEKDKSLINSSACANCTHSRTCHTDKGCQRFKCACSQFINSDPIRCAHANENPHVCPCPLDCYCKANTCKIVTNLGACICGHGYLAHRNGNHCSIGLCSCHIFRSEKDNCPNCMPGDCEREQEYSTCKYRANTPKRII